MLQLLRTLISIALVVILDRSASAYGNALSAANYRLPTSVRPVSYELRLQPRFDNGTFEGNVKIEAIVDESTKSVALHRGNLTILSTQIFDRDMSPILIQRSDYNESTEIISFLLEKELNKADNTIFLEFGFRGFLRNDLIGFYNSSYSDDRGNIRSDDNNLQS